MFATRLRYLPTPLIASAALAVLGAVLGGLLDGGASAVGAAAGVGMVAISYTLTVLAVAWADAINTRLVLPFGMGMYVLKIIWIGMIMLVLSSRGWAGLPALGFGVFAGIACWIAAQIWTVVRTAPREIVTVDRPHLTTQGSQE